jgi:hypothetical protein
MPNSEIVCNYELYRQSVGPWSRDQPVTPPLPTEDSTAVPHFTAIDNLEKVNPFFYEFCLLGHSLSGGHALV